MNPAERGWFVAFEGGEGSGKSTQAAWLARRVAALYTREPGGTALGQRIRSLVLDSDLESVDARAETLLLAADRAQHVDRVIRPALARGQHVVSDRFSGSMLAYQGSGRGLDVDQLRWISTWAAGGLEPDLVIFLDVDGETARDRLQGEPDRIEAAGRGFHERVVIGYRALAATDPDRWVTIDASASMEEVSMAVWKAWQELRLPPDADARMAAEHEAVEP